MDERDTHRANTEARAEVARGAGTAGEANLLRYLAAAAYREARTEKQAADVQDEEVTHVHPAAAGDPGAEHR